MANYRGASTSRKICCAFCCLLVLAIIAIGIAAAVLASTFKKPDVKVNNIRLVDGSTSVSGSTITAKWLADVIVSNENSYDIFVSTANVRTILQNVTPDAQIATGEVDNSNIKGGGAVTTLSLPLTLKWDTSQADTIPAIKTILDKCHASSGNTIPTTYFLDLRVKVFSILGPITVPTISTNIDTPCPNIA